MFNVLKCAVALNVAMMASRSTLGGRDTGVNAPGLSEKGLSLSPFTELLLAPPPSIVDI